MIQYFKNVVTGRIGHWNDAHNPVLEDLVRRTKALRHPDRLFAETFVVAGTLVLKELFIPDSSPRWRVEVKSVTSEQFRRLHSILQAYFNFAFAYSHGFDLHDIPRLVGNVSGDLTYGNQCFRELRGYQKANPSEVASLLPLGEITWRHLSTVLTPTVEVDSTEQVVFATMLAKHFMQASEVISRRIQNNAV